jgi:TolB protein
MRCFITALLFLMVPLWVQSHEEEIFVQLDDEVPLLPLYLCHFIDADSGFTSSYLKKLEDVLLFDLDHNGRTSVRQRNEHLSTKDFETLPKDPEAIYTVVAKVHDKKLSVRFSTGNDKAIKAIADISLTGTLEIDRKAVHQIADTLFKALFGKDGVASTRLLYTVKRKMDGSNQWSSEIWEADYDGGNPIKILKDGGYCVTPLYVPPSPGYRSGSFFYVSYLNGQPKIFYASFKEGIGRRFSYLRGNQLMPAISRQRDHVAFISDAAGNPDLFVQPFDLNKGALGKPRQIFASGQAVQGTPAFSPDGKKIAFVSNKDGAARIYVMDIPSEGIKLQEIKPKLISKQSRESTAPAWSPDGSKLAYCALTGSSRQIWIYDFEKGKARQLTQGPGNKENPTWAPDSLHLIFNSTGAHESELYLVNLNQPQAVKITGGPGEKRYPNWEPRP